MIKRSILILLAFFTGNILLSYGYTRFAQTRFKSFPQDTADALIVLFHDFKGPSGLSDETLRRCRYAVALFRKNRFAALVCSGGLRQDRSISGAELMAGWFLEHGVPQSKVHVENDSCDSLANIRKSQRLLRALGIRSAMVISSAMHLLRLKFLLGREAHDESIRLALRPYAHQEAQPELNRLTFVLQANYEWISYGLYLLLPDSIYQQIIHAHRRCGPDRL